MKIILIFSFMVLWAFGAFEATIKPINKYIKQRMVTGRTWHKGCPVSPDDLRYIRLKHRNFYRSERMGEIIVHKDIEADNTSAFNCRNATGSKKWSKHSYGKAIDINPIENPYISRKGRISHQKSLIYRKRVHKKSTFADKAVLLKDDKATKIFKKYGWKWGGDWSGVKDYQHFSLLKNIPQHPFDSPLQICRIDDKLGICTFTYFF
jgi:poly-gamma-glutamate synthesis protein (capsule biosynthesis protein)